MRSGRNSRTVGGNGASSTSSAPAVPCGGVIVDMFTDLGLLLGPAHRNSGSHQTNVTCVQTVERPPCEVNLFGAWVVARLGCLHLSAILFARFRRSGLYNCAPWRALRTFSRELTSRDWRPASPPRSSSGASSSSTELVGINQSSPVAVILGAGFSAAAGVPLANRLLDRRPDVDRVTRQTLVDRVVARWETWRSRNGGTTEEYLAQLARTDQAGFREAVWFVGLAVVLRMGIIQETSRPSAGLTPAACAGSGPAASWPRRSPAPLPRASRPA